MLTLHKRIAIYTFFMKSTRFIVLMACLAVVTSAYAQSDVVRQINEYGKFDTWSRRSVKESGLIGGATKYLYEFYGDPSDVRQTDKTPYSAPEGYLWRTNNVLAVICGIVKTNNTVFPEERDGGYCARIEAHIEEVKCLGIDMEVVCQGALLVGALPEPIKDTKSPMAKVLYGLPFNGQPKALRLDYKAHVGCEVYRGTGFSKLKALGYPDSAEITFVLQKRWEDEDGRIHAQRVATGIERISEDIPEWVNGHEVPLHYGDITNEPFYEEYMGLKTDPETAYHAINSRGKNVIVEEDGWAEIGTEPNYMMLHFIASCGKAFYGGVGNTLWVDNVEIVM